MRKNISVTVLMICAGAILAACAASERVNVNGNSAATMQATGNANRNASVAAQATAPTPAATPRDGVRRISVADLQAALEKNEAVIIDVRGEESYAAGHIKGARLFPEDQIARRANELPRDKLIVTYCA